MKTRMNQLPPQSDGKMQSRPLNNKNINTKEEGRKFDKHYSC